MVGKIKIDIWGSCVSRDIFGLCLPDTSADIPWAFINPNIRKYAINYYYAQCSFISAFSEHYGPLISENEISKSLPNFVKKCIVSEFNGTTANQFQNSDSEWLIVDFRYIIYGLVAIDYKDGPTDYICDRNIDEITRFLDTTGISYSIRHLRYTEFDYSNQFKKFIRFVKAHYGHNIILIESRETESFFNRGGGVSRYNRRSFNPNT